MSLRLGALDDTKSQDEIAKLVRGAAQGQEPAWRALVDNFAGLVWSVIRGYRLNPADAADVSQTTWLRLAEHIASLRQPERVGAWLVTTAGRECLVLLRRSRRQGSRQRRLLHRENGPEPASQPEAQVIEEGRCGGDALGGLWFPARPLPGPAPASVRRPRADLPRDLLSHRHAGGEHRTPVRGRCLAQLRERASSSERHQARIPHGLG